MIRLISFSIIKTTKFASGALAKYWALLQSYAAMMLNVMGVMDKEYPLYEYAQQVERENGRHFQTMAYFFSF